MSVNFSPKQPGGSGGGSVSGPNLLRGERDNRERLAERRDSLGEIRISNAENSQTRGNRNGQSKGKKLGAKEKTARLSRLTQGAAATQSDSTPRSRRESLKRGPRKCLDQREGKDRTSEIPQGQLAELLQQLLVWKGSHSMCLELANKSPGAPM